MPTSTTNAQTDNKNKLKSDGKSIKLQYPKDLGENYPHSVDFTIYIPQKSQYNKTVKKLPTTAVSNYDKLAGFGAATNLAQIGFTAQGGYQIAKDAAAGAATGAMVTGGRGIIGKITGFLGGAAGGALGAAASVFTNSKTQAAIKGGIATEFIKQQTEVTGLKVERKAQRIDKMISLYMPANFFTTYGHDYDQISVKEAGGTLGMLGGAAASLGIKDFSSVAKDPEGFLNALKALPGASNPYVALATGAMGSTSQVPIVGGSLVGSGYSDVAAFNMGYAQNPMLEVLYRGTNFRTFQFEFMFQPKSQSEAMEALDIIKTFKFHAAPETNPLSDPIAGIAQGGVSMPMFFVPPSEFGITLRYGDLKNPHLPRIGRCVLNRVDVDYSPGGNWQTYHDGVPVEVRLRLEFTEVELVTKKKIDSEGF